MKKINQKLGALYDLSRLSLQGDATTEYCHILLACMPKSGSTFLSATIGHLPNFYNVSLVPGFERREQELDHLNLLYYNRMNFIAQHHVKYSETLKKQMNQFSIRPLVLIRNIFDVMVSLRDHIRAESRIGPLVYIPFNVSKWSDEKLEIFLAINCIPWYISFYLSWQECEKKLLINYADLLLNPNAVLDQIFSYANININTKHKKLILEKGGNSFTRKNKAVNGRGKDIHPEARAHIMRVVSYYDEYDLSPIGIE